METLSAIGWLAARACLSAVFIYSALDKIVCRQVALKELRELGTPFPTLVLPLVILLQLVAGLMVLLGFFIQLGADALMIFTAAATLMGHRFWIGNSDDFRREFTTALEHLAIIGGLLLLVLHGAGPISLDARLGLW